MAYIKLIDNSSVWVVSVYSIKGDPEPTVIRPKYTDFEDMASKINTDILVLYKAYDYNIVLESRISPPYQSIYNLLECKLKVL